MILVDTSVWIDHLNRRADARLSALLDAGEVLQHPFVVAEIALGNLRNRAVVLRSLGDLPSAAVATNAELLDFIERRRLSGAGIGFVDCHLLASATLTPETQLLTRDRRLRVMAEGLGLAATP